MEISYDYIRGLVEGKGTFTFSGRGDGTRVPAFSIKMHARDKKLLEAVRDKLKLKNKIYEYKYNRRDGHNRGAEAVLIVREFPQLKNIIIPLFYGKLVGNRGTQFNQWLEKIGSDPSVPETFKFLYKLHEWGYYRKNPKY